MTKETAKKIIDFLFKMYDEDKEDAFINHHTKGLILDFIGGEPFMNIEVIDYASQYFIDQCITKKHIWLTNTRFNISSNGILYFEPRVQAYLNKFKPFISLTITIDGPKELHDSCRKDYNNNGSFDRAIAAFDDWNKYNQEMATKVTIAPENLIYLNEIMKFFIEHNCTEVNANPIYEREWTINDAQLYYKELKIIADTLLEHPIKTNLFNSYYGKPLSPDENNNWCGGTGAMLAFDPDGNAYPCLRYMKSSLGDSIAPLIIGNVNGIYESNEAK